MGEADNGADVHHELILIALGRNVFEETVRGEPGIVDEQIDSQARCST